MRKKDYKGRCEKRKVTKNEEVCKLYDPIQSSYLDLLEVDDNIVKICCNKELEGLGYTSDFYCLKRDQELMVRECVSREHLTKPLTTKLLDQSRQYWANKGIADWGVVTNEEE